MRLSFRRAHRWIVASRRRRERHRIYCDEKINSIDWSPDGQRIATARWNGSVRFWDGNSNSPALTLIGHEAGA
jgi:WD40 repeat protein